MDFTIQSSRPIWQQLTEQLRQRIVTGAYPPGSRFPAVRELAAEAGVNPNTMQRAMSQLETDGLVTTNRTLGRTVTDKTEVLEEMRRRLARERTEEVFTDMNALGYDRAAAADLAAREKESGKHFRFTLTTNGVLLNDEITEFCNREMSNVVLSLDGRKEVNDRMRPTRNGKGSYDIIVPKFQKFAEARGDRDYFIRGTFTHENLEFSKDVLHFADLGFRKMSMEPVVAPPEAFYAIREEDLPVILREYDLLAKEYVERRRAGKGFVFFHFQIDLKQGPCVAKRLSGCGSGTEYLAVTPWGDLYPCHQFVGNEDFLLGNVDEGITNTALRDEFKLCNVYAKPKCRECFARFYCSGGCAANSWNFHKSLTDAYDIGCEMQKKRIECAIMIKAAQMMDEAAEKENESR